MKANVARYLEELLDNGVTGVLVHPDTVALLMAQIAVENGRSVPADISIVAYDDVVASMATPPRIPPGT